MTLNIIVPVYNEVESLEQFVVEMDKFLKETPVETTVTFVNDGSSDGSRELIEHICQGKLQYRKLHLDRNYGLSTAIKAGIDNTVTDLVGYIDSDIQTTPMDFLNYFQYFPEFDMVNGIRARRNDKFTKKISSKIANWFRRTMINDGIQDTGCPLKIMKTSYARKIPFFDGMHRFIPALIQLQKGKVKQIPIRHFPRYAGTAKYHLWNRLKKPFFDTIAFRWMRSRYINYKLSGKNE